MNTDRLTFDDYSPGVDQVTSARAGRPWAWGLSVCLVLVVCIRLFSENLSLLPGIVQYVDVPLTALLLFCGLLGLIRRGHRRGRSRLGLVLMLFILISLGSTLANASRTALLPAGMFMFNFACPFIFAFLIIDAPLNRADIRLVMKTFFVLGLVQICGLRSTAFPDSSPPPIPTSCLVRSGETPISSHTSWACGCCMCWEEPSSERTGLGRGEPRLSSSQSYSVFGLFYAAQYRAMLIFYTPVMVLTLWASPTRFLKRMRETVLVAGISLIMLIITATAYPNLKLLQVFDLVEDTSPIVHSGKIQAIQNVATMYGDMPHTAFLGSGPATFASRSFRVFADEPSAKEQAGNVAVGLMGGMYTTDVSARYVRTIQSDPIQGGTTVADPWSSFTALAAEVGVPGLLICMAPYIAALVFARRRMTASIRAGDRQGTQLAFACFGGLLLLLMQAMFDNWLEATRVTIPLWILVGLLYSSARLSRVLPSGYP